jgi:hypothetical protein
VSNPNDTSTVDVRNSLSMSASPSQESVAGDTTGGSQGVTQLPTDVVSKPPGEQLPGLSQPSGTLARSLPDWDLEPPAFLVRRGEEA